MSLGLFNHLRQDSRTVISPEAGLMDRSITRGRIHGQFHSRTLYASDVELRDISSTWIKTYELFHSRTVRAPEVGLTVISTAWGRTYGQFLQVKRKVSPSEAGNSYSSNSRSKTLMSCYQSHSTRRVSSIVSDLFFQYIRTFVHFYNLS